MKNFDSIFESQRSLVTDGPDAYGKVLLSVIYQEQTTIFFSHKERSLHTTHRKMFLANFEVVGTAVMKHCLPCFE